MIALLAFLFFAEAPPITSAGPAAPRAYNPGDYRLAGAAGDQARAIININETSVTTDGHPWARVYLVGDYNGSLHAYVAYTRFDCAGRSLITEHVWALDRNLEVIGDVEVNARDVAAAQSLGAQEIDFMCGGRTVQLQRPYLGSDWKSAIRMADPRFR